MLDSFQALQSKPVSTQAVTTALLWGVGDMASQRVERKKNFDWRRTMQTMAYAGCCLGPIGHFWYLGLDTVAARYLQPGTLANVATKVLADSLIYGPLHVALFFGYMEIVEGHGLQGAAKKLKQDFWPTFAAELGFWPAFQAMNFWRVPVEHQLLAVNIACIFDSTFLCWAKHEDQWAASLMEKIKGRGSQSDGDGK